jgi:hypothetical protein
MMVCDLLLTEFPPPCKGRVRVGVECSNDCRLEHNYPTPIPAEEIALASAIRSASGRHAVRIPCSTLPARGKERNDCVKL